MKIAMLTINYLPFVGGVPISVERQARHLAALGHEVTVFAPDYGETEQDGRKETAKDSGNGTITEIHERKLKVVRFRASRRKMKNKMLYPRLFMPEILKAFEEETFDCIHVHHPIYVGNLAFYLKRKYRIPVIYTWHTRYENYLHYLDFFENASEGGWLKRNLYRLAKEKVVPGYMKWFANQCDMVFAPTPGMADMIQSQGVRSKVRVLPTGLEESFYRSDFRKTEEIRRRYAKGKRWMFCTVGRLEEEKNPEFLLKGIKILKESVGDCFQMLFIGEGSRQELLFKEVQEEGLQDVVTFMGNIPNGEVKHYLDAADLFLFASTSETQGIVLAEAMAAGCPVVAVSASGVNDMIQNGKNGFITEELPEQWAAKVLEALQPAQIAGLKIGAWKTAEDYRAVRIAKREEALYRECIGAEQEGTEYAAISIYQLFKAS